MVLNSNSGSQNISQKFPLAAVFAAGFQWVPLHLIELDYKQNQFGMNYIHSEDRSAPKCILRLNV